ncbi:hypothetical protein CBS147339_4767 [Penicillium roqueforti]|uniref:Genomic scaffold, ProqFM164S03 n=1 Tax=Penicillium roqueforti (strain FM164) TaxID=1365484 RepID=W6QD85_PENRF|nr:hypothetical protein DTO012A8_9735 [Penicillium roqueforti]CDM34653.1 unnamed protein product [Penicillium roqueforti FM164]KAI3076797.1 hypothetical protein CBS147339_4767 [Penicillium roqueforti]KAI3089501.1 hypothetical protein CBS147338_9649 [Penicillium roqueforti]KAI3146732.1 hypothetical protein CBS147325_4613 [Penicillium roqueforti]
MSWSTEGAEGAEGTEGTVSESIIATDIVLKEHHKLFFKLKTSARKFLGNHIDRHELKETTDKLEDKSKQYKSVQISEINVKNVEQWLYLQFDSHDMEMKDV